MARALADIIGRDFLKCGVCLEPYNDPRALPCHHGFCCECLQNSLESRRDKKTLNCPTCRQVVKLSKGGVQDLPVHFLVTSLKDAVEMDNKTKKPVCDNCDVSTNKVTVRCMDCEQYLCATCHAPHNILKDMKGHRVISMEDILSGKVDLHAEEKTICSLHKQPQKFYCQNEQKMLCQECVILNKCAIAHERITIDQAAMEKSKELEELLMKNCEILKEYHNSVKEVSVTEKELKINTQTAKHTLVGVEQEYIKLVKKIVKGFVDEIDKIKKERMTELDGKMTNLMTTMVEIAKVNENVTQVIQSPYNIRVISSHATLSTKLKTLSKSKPNKVDKTLGYVKFQAANIKPLPSIGQLLKKGTLGKSWKCVGKFSTGDFNRLHGLALDLDDDIVVCSWEKGVKVFTRNGDVKSTLYDSPGSVDVAVLPGKKYVTAPLGDMEIKICDSHGKQVKACSITDMNNAPSDLNTLAVDYDNKIIVGQVENTISIHNTNGSLISKFATASASYRLAATSNRDIVSSFYDKELKRGTSVQFMDYSGGNVRVIQPPDEAKEWSPGFVCCGQGEIFVSNPCDPGGVYRFTSEGDYLGCVTKQVEWPSGIALSRNGMELFVADYDDSHVKIFQRP